MVIVIVRWYIKKGQEKEFEDMWITKFKSTWIDTMEPTPKNGLFREFFSKPVDIPEDKYHTLDVESLYYATFINVGIWRQIEDFDEAIGRNILPRGKHFDATKSDKELLEVYDFEFKLRERVVMNVE